MSSGSSISTRSGVCEGLCHWRDTIQPLAAKGTLEPLVAADLDLVNMFGNAECPASPPTGEPSRATCLAARLLCPPERQHEFQGWDTSYVHDTVDVVAPEQGTTALGSAFGSREHINARAWESVRAFDEMRSAIGSVDHAPTKMVLTRQCADVSKLVYHMRIKDLLVAFDGQLRASVSASLKKATCWTTGVSCGGLGLRTALGIALPAFVASRIMCRPLVSTVVDLVATLPPNAAQLLLGQLDEALAERELSWRNVLSGVEEAMQDQPTPSLRHARGITQDDGDGDDEHLLALKRLKIQVLITTCVDTSVH